MKYVNTRTTQTIRNRHISAGAAARGSKSMDRSSRYVELGALVRDGSTAVNVAEENYRQPRKTF